MNILTEKAQQQLDSVMQQISAAAQRGDLVVVENLTKKASELRAILDQYVALERRLAALTDASDSVAAIRKEPRALRELGVSVTQGMINQNLLTLSDAVKRGAIRVGETLTIETPDGDSFETVLLEAGNKLQERGKIARFYRSSHVRAGEVVLLREITPGRWLLQKQVG